MTHEDIELETPGGCDSGPGQHEESALGDWFETTQILKKAHFGDIARLLWHCPDLDRAGDGVRDECRDALHLCRRIWSRSTKIASNTVLDVQDTAQPRAYGECMLITQDDIPALARGCAVLGTGGGGEVTTSALIAHQALSECGPVEVVTLADLPPEGILMPVGMIGAPSVSIEKLSSGTEIGSLRRLVEHHTGQPVVALMVSEIGGGNGVLPAAWAARSGLPLLDADGMGRAFPQVDMMSMNVAGLPPSLIVLADERDNAIIVQAVDGHWAELIARSVTEVFGGSAAMSDYVMPVQRARGAIVEGSVSNALRIGRAVVASEHPVEGLLAAVQGIKLIEGKVVDVQRRTAGGFVRGSVVVEGYGADQGRLVRIEIQNENLVALEDGQVRVIVPDLITLVDSQTADAVATETVRYGQRVAVIAMPCDPIWRTKRGLEVAGPRVFGYDFDYVPVEVLHAS